MTNVKITQADLIKESFIRYYLKQYEEDGPSKPSDEVAELLGRENYILKLTIDKLSKHPNTPDSPFGGTANDYVMEISSPDLIAVNHYFTPMYTTDDGDTYTQEVNTKKKFTSIDAIPESMENDLFLIASGNKPGELNYQIVLKEEALNLPEDELEEMVIGLFKTATVVDFKDEETIADLFVNTETMFKYLPERQVLSVTSPAVTGELPITLDTRKAKGWVESSGFLVKDTDGKVHKIYAMGENFTNNQVPEKDIEIIVPKSGRVILQGQDIQGLLSFPGAFIDDMDTEYSFQLKGTNIVEVPDELPPHITELDDFLYDSSKFNDPKISDWDYSNLVSMDYFLGKASSFNQPLNLNTSKVTSMAGFLFGASSFNSPLSLDTGKVTNMEWFLRGASDFNQPLNLDTGKVTNMVLFLAYASNFNQPLNLDTRNVTNMDYFLTHASNFNQPLNLDTRNVTNMEWFLAYASSFNQDLSHLCVPLIVSEPRDFAHETTNYTKPRPIWGTCPTSETPIN